MIFCILCLLLTKVHALLFGSLFVTLTAAAQKRQKEPPPLPPQGPAKNRTLGFPWGSLSHLATSHPTAKAHPAPILLIYLTLIE
jgi:hypothetical protein